MHFARLFVTLQAITTKLNFMKRIINLILAIVLMCMTTLTVSATEYITDVMLIGGGSDSELNSLRSTYTAQGWTVINYDLNGGIPWGTRNVQGILLLYKTTSSTGSSGTPITDFYLQNKFASETSETLTHFGLTDSRQLQIW